MLSGICLRNCILLLIFFPLLVICESFHRCSTISRICFTLSSRVEICCFEDQNFVRKYLYTSKLSSVCQWQKLLKMLRKFIVILDSKGIICLESCLETTSVLLHEVHIFIVMGIFCTITKFWFDAPIFCDRFQSLLLPRLKKLEGKKVVIYDNLSSHLTMNVLQLWQENNIG